MGHTLLLSRVGLDVDDVSNLVDGQVGRKGDCTLLCKSARIKASGGRFFSGLVRW